MSISPGPGFFKRIAASFSLVVLILTSLILTGSMQPTPVKAQGEGEGGGLEGTWLNDVKVVACSPGPRVQRSHIATAPIPRLREKVVLAH
jgi:hypothetical protein